MYCLVSKVYIQNYNKMLSPIKLMMLHNVKIFFARKKKLKMLLSCACFVIHWVFDVAHFTFSLRMPCELASCKFNKFLGLMMPERLINKSLYKTHSQNPLIPNFAFLVSNTCKLRVDVQQFCVVCVVLCPNKLTRPTITKTKQINNQSTFVTCVSDN